MFSNSEVAKILETSELCHSDILRFEYEIVIRTAVNITCVARASFADMGPV